MITKIKTIVLTIGFILIIASCSKKPEDACNCIKNAANDFMLQGVKPKSIYDLKEPCKEIIEKFSDDSKARAMITACLDEIKIAIESKTLLPIEGEEMKSFQEYTFNNVKEFNTFFKDKGFGYKYLNCKIIIKNAYFHTDTYKNDFNQKDCILPIFQVTITDSQTYNEDEKPLSLFFEDESVKAQIKADIHFDLYEGEIFDVTNKLKNDYPLYSPMTDIARVINTYYAHPDRFGLGTWQWKFKEMLEKLETECGVKNFRNDAKNGRYLVLEEEEFVNKYGKNYSLTKGEIVGFISNDGTVFSVKSLKTQDLGLPSDLKGKSYDIDKILESIEKERSEFVPWNK